MMRENPHTPADAAKAIVDEAIKRGTKDNVSAIVVDFAPESDHATSNETSATNSRASSEKYF